MYAVVLSVILITHLINYSHLVNSLWKQLSCHCYWFVDVACAEVCQVLVLCLDSLLKVDCRQCSILFLLLTTLPPTPTNAPSATPSLDVPGPSWRTAPPRAGRRHDRQWTEEERRPAQQRRGIHKVSRVLQAEKPHLTTSSSRCNSYVIISY